MPLPEDYDAPKFADELPSYSLEEEEAPSGWRKVIKGCFCQDRAAGVSGAKNEDAGLAVHTLRTRLLRTAV